MISIKIDTSISELTLDLKTSSDTGTSNIDNVTKDKTPTLKGTSEANSTIKIYDGNTLLDTVTADINGNWVFTTGVLNDGNHDFRVEAKDTAGNILTSNTMTVKIDTSLSTPTIDLKDSSDTGSSSTDNITSDKTPTLKGTAEANSTVKIYNGSTLIGTTTANGNGNWEYTTSSLNNGNYNFKVKSIDAAGNSKDSSSLGITVEQLYNVNVEIGTMYSHAGGFVIMGNVYQPTSFRTPDMVYTDAPAGTAVTLEITFTVSGYGTFTMKQFDVIVDANGNYRFTKIDDAPATRGWWGQKGSIPNWAWDDLGSVSEAIGCGKPMQNISIKAWIGDKDNPESNIDTDSAIGRGSPLVLDLDNDGVETIGVEQGVTFDIDGDGIKDKTGWAGADDGLLVRDINGDGKINDARELFGEEMIKADGTKAKDGFDALSDYDSNNDGVVNVQDENFNELKVWQDKNSDGITQANELLSLEEAGVSEFNLRNTQSNKIDENGNKIGLEGSYTDSDGNKKDMHDIWFSYESGYEADESINLEDIASNVKNNIVDLTNDKKTSLHIDFDDILDISDENNELKILGDDEGNPDKVILSDTDKWQAEGKETVDNVVYNVYKGIGTSSTVKLLIEDDIVIDL